MIVTRSNDRGWPLRRRVLPRWAPVLAAALIAGTAMAEVVPEARTKVVPEARGKVAPEARGKVVPEARGKVAPEARERTSPEPHQKLAQETRKKLSPQARRKINPEGRRKSGAKAPAKEAPPEERILRIDRENIAVIDGDSVLIDGREWRLLGFDAPEFVDAKCEAEHRAGMFAKRRLTELLAAASRFEMRFWGQIDKQNRAFGELLVDGRNVGDVMIAENYARAYSGGRIRAWCAATTRHDLPPEQ